MPASKALHAKAVALQGNIEQIIRGKTEAVRLLLVTLFARGHALIEDIPGVGKTALARALARSITGSFHRLQFTPDLLPADITGASIYNMETHDFVFKPGPIFAHVVLADEINRATPKTQSALLESMNEGSVSVDGKTYTLPEPFLVVATQNPIEYLGTYPLPESQLDRFLLTLNIGYPDREAEMEILKARRSADPLDALAPCITVEEILGICRETKAVRVDDAIHAYMLSIAEHTRRHRELIAGVSPRGLLHLMHAAQALAFLEGRDYVVPDDIQALAKAVLAHRLIARQRRYQLDGSNFTADLIAGALEAVPVPR